MNIFNCTKIKLFILILLIFNNIQLFSNENNINNEINLTIDKVENIEEIEKLKNEKKHFILFNEIKSKYLKTNNQFLNVFKNYNEFTKLILEKENLYKEIEIKNIKKEKKDDLKKNIEEINTKISFYENINKEISKIINKIEINTENKELKITFFNFLIQKDKKEFKELEKKVLDIEKEFNEAIEYLNKIHLEVIELNLNKDEFLNFNKEVINAIEYFENTKILLIDKKNNLSIYQSYLDKKLKEYVEKDLKEQLINIFILIIILSVYFFLKKINYNRNIDDEIKYNKYNKTLILITSLILSLYVLIVYIENIKYAITIIGFIGAALTITMKEIIQSMIGWVYIIFSGFLKVGDRILINKDNKAIIGDIIQISLTKIMIYETINHTTATELKRAGRIISIPNNFVFTNSVYNYNHYSMKTIYDLIEFDLEFNNNFEMIEEKIKEIIFNNTEKYIDMARKQYTKLQDKYELRNKRFEPKIQFSVNDNKTGISMFIWFISPYRGILDTRSEIVKEILKEFNTNENIFLLNQKRNSKNKKKLSIPKKEESNSSF